MMTWTILMATPKKDIEKKIMWIHRKYYNDFHNNIIDEQSNIVVPAENEIY